MQDKILSKVEIIHSKSSEGFSREIIFDGKTIYKDFFTHKLFPDSNDFIEHFILTLLGENRKNSCNGGCYLCDFFNFINKRRR